MSGGNDVDKKNGFSLTGVLIASGIGALIFGFIADMIIYQYKDQKHLSQKLEMTDFANTLITTFAKPGNCTCQFANNATNPNLANFGALHFDSTNVSGTESISVNKLYSGCLGGANPPILLAANNQPLHGSQDLIVDTVKLINLKPSGGGANPNDWQGQWQVIFKVASGSLNKPSPPVLVTQKFTIDPTVPTAALINSCNGISSGTGTTNFLAKWSGITGMLMDSEVYEEPLLKKIGIGTTTPDDALEVVFGAGRGITATKFGQVGARGGAVQVRGSRGTQAAPTALLANDYLGWFYGEGYSGAGFTSHATPTGMAILTTENWNLTDNGSRLSFFTIPNGTANGLERMTVQENGNVGIGTVTPNFPLTVGDNLGEGNAFGVAASGDVIVTGGSDRNWALYKTDAVGALQTLMFINTSNQASFNGGNVGIGTASPQTTLQVAGVISPATNNTYTLGNATYRFTEVYATNGVINTSDRREKKDIYNTDLGLDFINKLRPVSYRWNTGVDNDVHYGLIAQEAEQAIADSGNTEKTSIVTHDEATDRYGVRYSELISPLIKAVQELYKRLMGVEAHQSTQDREIASVKAENEKLKQENSAKSKEMAELKARLDKIEKALKSK